MSQSTRCEFPGAAGPGFAVVDRRLNEVLRTVELHHADDLWSLIPGELPREFTTIELAESTGRSISFAQKIAYCLRLAGAVMPVRKTGNRIVYERA